jgi:hypothetical protein
MMWENMAEADRPKMTMKYALCFLGNLRLDTHTHTKYIILVACLRQQALRERAPMSRYICIIGLALWQTNVDLCDIYKSVGGGHFMFVHTSVNSQIMTTGNKATRFSKTTTTASWDTDQL